MKEGARRGRGGALAHGEVEADCDAGEDDDAGFLETDAAHVDVDSGLDGGRGGVGLDHYAAFIRMLVFWLEGKGVGSGGTNLRLG